MKKETFTLYLTALISGILITMFISALVTYMALSDTALFIEVWPVNWFYAALSCISYYIISQACSHKDNS